MESEAGHKEAFGKVGLKRPKKRKKKGWMTKVGCTICGASILAATAQSTGGICMPCKTGRRQIIDAGKRRVQEEREKNRSDPFRKLWHDLVHRVHSTPLGFAGLSDQERIYYAVGTLDGAIYRGGFELYFFNSTGTHYTHAVVGLETTGATQASALLQRAKQVLFAFDDVPEDATKRRLLLNKNASPSRSERLEHLDQLYCQDPDTLQRRLEIFAREHDLLPKASGSG
jgi:hypothetical protein